MADRPSTPLLRLLRDMAQKKGLNTAALAQAAGMDRARLKHLLSGAEPITVDEFLQVAKALDISPQDMGLSPEALGGFDDDSDDMGADVLPLRAVGRRERVSTAFVPDPYGNHAEQAIRLGFALGCDMFFITEVKLLDDSGVPRSVLSRYPEHLPLRLDASFHRHNDPQFLPEGLQLNLSFDSIYTCLFPWTCFKQITFFPLPPSDLEDEQPQKQMPKGPKRGHLRLIE